MYFEYYFQEQPTAAGYCVIDTSGADPAVEWRTTLPNIGIDIVRNRYAAYLDGAHN